MRRRGPPDRHSLRRRGVVGRRRLRGQDRGPEAGGRPLTRAPCSSTSAAPDATRSTPPTPTARKPKKQQQGGERTNGPNFNVRKESRDDVLFAIRNGGFSGAIMPANVVVGDDAEAVADFLSKYSGKGKLAEAAGRGRRARPQGDPRRPGRGP